MSDPLAPIFTTELMVVPAPELPKAPSVAWDDEYVERYWLGVLGPSALWAYRRLVAQARAGQSILNVTHLAVELGLGGGTGPNSPVIRTLVRLARFHVIAVVGWQLQVPFRLRLVSPNSLARMPEYLRIAHELDVAPMVARAA